MTTTRQQIEDLAARSVVPVPVPEWGGITVHVGPIGIAGLAVLDGIDGTKDQERYACLAVIAGACEADGTALFTAADLPFLRRHGMGTLRVAKEVMRANKLMETEDEAKNG